MKYILASIILSLISWTISAKEYHVHSGEELNAINPVAGDKIIMKGEVWRDQKLVFKGQGTEASPILLTVETPGTVVLTGSSSLVIEGSWLVVAGLSFKDGYTLKENVISFSKKSENCRLTNTAIVNYNNPDKATRNSWIVLYGTHNRVDHCYTEGKTHLGTTIGVYAVDRPNHHRIDHNYFANRPPLGRNGGETIRIGTGEWSMYDSQTLVEENIFVNCDGEIEIISNKSTNNIIRNNLFYESEGMLTLRHGNKANVYGNYFIGNQKKGTGGIRIIGEDHKISNNYFHGLTGTGVRAAITFMNAWENPPLHGYWQIKNAEVRENIIVDCTEPIVIGSGKDEKTVLPPLNSLIADNMVVSAKESAIVWTETKAKNVENIKFENNIFFKVKKPKNEAYPKGILIKDPKLKQDKYGVMERTKTSAKEKGFKVNNDMKAALFNAKDIGPHWLQLERDFRVK